MLGIRSGERDKFIHVSPENHPGETFVSGRMVEAAGIEPASETGSTEICYVRSRP